MAATPTGGVTGGRAAGGDIALSFEELQRLGEETASTSSNATAAGSMVRGTQGNHGAYGSYPPAQDLAAHHDAVAEVFTQTLQALSSEMEEFGMALKQSANNYADADEGIQAALASISSRLTSGNTASTAYDTARTNENHRLVKGEDAVLDDATIASANAEGGRDEVLSDLLESAGVGPNVGTETDAATVDVATGGQPLPLEHRPIE